MNIYRAAAIAVALVAGGVGLWRGTWAVGGSDSSCYALMAAAFASGQLQPTTSLANAAPWPDASRTFAPGGFIPSPMRPDAASPICAPGFSLLLAPFYFVGGRDAVFLLTPLAGAFLVYVTFVFGRQMAGNLAGLGAAIVVASAPVFVFQVVQPMNDIVVAALWTMVFTLAARPRDHTGWMSVTTGVALLVRPNLAPVAVVVAAWCFAAGSRRLAVFCVGLLPFVMTIGFLNASLYGHPLQSGYGPVTDLFAVNHVADNLSNYGTALLETQLAFPLLGLVAPFFVPANQRRLAVFALSAAAAVIGLYLFYRPLPEWWYLRFLLPALPVLTVLAMAALVFGSRRTTIVIPVVIIVVAYGATSVAMREALDLSRLEGRFRLAGDIARERMPDNAVFISVWESGSVRYHAGRDALLWDALDPAALDAAVAWLSARGRDPFIMIEEWEEPLFRERFGGRSVLGQLDWPPQFDIERRVKIFRPADRERYLAGGAIPTQYIVRDRR